MTNNLIGERDFYRDLSRAFTEFASKVEFIGKRNNRFLLNSSSDYDQFIEVLTSLEVMACNYRNRFGEVMSFLKRINS